MSSITTLEELRKLPNLKTKILEILDKRFIYAEPIAEILAAAIYSKQNVILYGPGGHGKSEMVEWVLEGLGLWNRNDPVNSPALIQSFGEGLTEDALWGGIDFRKLNSPTDPEMWFNVEKSFLNYPVAVFEELFDAPAFCLLPLKHTLQAGFLAKNGRSYPMQTQLIIACTNRDPQDIAEMGETYVALLERFVLRQEVAWKNYKREDYQRLLHKHPLSAKAEASTIKLLASLMEDCFSVGQFISPRTAMKAMDIVYGQARSNSRDTIEPGDFIALKHVAGFQQVAVKFQEQLAHKLAEVKARENLQLVVDDYKAIVADIDNGVITKVIEWCMVARKLFLIQDRFKEISVPDDLFEQRNQFITDASALSSQCLIRARDATRI